MLSVSSLRARPKPPTSEPHGSRGPSGSSWGPGPGSGSLGKPGSIPGTRLLLDAAQLGAPRPLLSRDPANKHSSHQARPRPPCLPRGPCRGGRPPQDAPTPRFRQPAPRWPARWLTHLSAATLSSPCQDTQQTGPGHSPPLTQPPVGASGQQEGRPLLNIWAWHRPREEQVRVACRVPLGHPAALPSLPRPTTVPRASSAATHPQPWRPETHRAGHTI